MIQFDRFLNFYLENFSFLTPEDLMLLVPNIQYTTVKKNTLIIKKNTTNTRLYWVYDGLLRLFYKENGKDITFDFAKEGSYITSVDSIIHQNPSTYSIEALTDTQLYSIDYTIFTELKADNKNLLKLEIEILKHYVFNSVHQNIYKSKPKNVENLYQQIFNDYKNYINQIPAKYIASYLGITEVSLSRIKKRILYKNL